MLNFLRAGTPRSSRRVRVTRMLNALAALGLLLGASAMAASPLPAPVAAALKRQGLTAQGLSLYVHEIGRDEPLLSVAADIPRNPASSLKLLTTLVALEELGPAYTWRTEAYTRGQLGGGRLAGDLHLKGYGDPYLVLENFWRLLRGLRQQGLQSIDGDLVLDQSHFAAEDEDPADFDGRPNRAYNVLPRALLVNFQAVHLRFLPGAEGLRVVADPPVPLENRIRLMSDRCRGWADGWAMRVRGEKGGGARLVFDGKYQADCGERELFRVFDDGPGYVHGVFNALWREQGGTIAGGVREDAVPADAQPFYTWYSPPLADVIRSINKYSNNVMTRQLLLTLGAERHGAPGTTEKGARVVHAWLERQGMNFPELVLDNGAGLSREARISARHLAQVLLAAYRSAYMPEYISALPVSALDGTLKNRFGGTLAGRLHLKTGSLNGVRSLAGYMLNAAGRRVIVVYLHNHPRANTDAAEAVQRELLEWIYSQGQTTVAASAAATPSRSEHAAVAAPAQ